MFVFVEQGRIRLETSVEAIEMCFDDSCFTVFHRDGRFKVRNDYSPF